MIRDQRRNEVRGGEALKGGLLIGDSDFVVAVAATTIASTADSPEIVKLDIPRLGTWRKQEQELYEQILWPPLSLRIGLLKSSALQNDGLDAPKPNSSGDQS
jgi:hypothetical protein